MQNNNEDNRSIPATFAGALRRIRLEQGKSQVEFSKTLGISQGYLSDLERGNKQPSDTLLIALTSRYGAIPGVVIPPVSAAPGSGTLPLLASIEAQPQADGLPGVPIDHVRLPGMAESHFAVIAKGNFMAPTIVDGDLVLLTATEGASPGEIVLVNNNWGEAILRRYRVRDGEVFFSSDNSSYKPFSPTPETRVLAKVVAIWRRM